MLEKGPHLLRHVAEFASLPRCLHPTAMPYPPDPESRPSVRDDYRNGQGLPGIHHGLGRGNDLRPGFEKRRQGLND